jgi:hypothetical protein
MIFYINGKHKFGNVVDVYVTNMLKYLKLHKLTNNLLVIEFVETLERGNLLGECEGDKTEATILIARSSKDGKVSFMQQMFSLSHEMAHVKQYFRGELSNDKDGKWKWKKEIAEEYKYEDQPWEKEALILENELFLKCFPFEMI